MHNTIMGVLGCLFLAVASAWSGDAVPKPLGFGVTLHQQDQKFRIKALTVNIPADLSAVNNIRVDNELLEANVKLDVWLLPFLNVFGLIGNIEGETNVKLMPSFADLDVEYDGVVYGAGVVLAAGRGRWFGSLTAAYTDTSLDTSDSSVEAWIVSPKFGMTLSPANRIPVALWVGGMYQSADEAHQGTISVPMLGAVSYAVELEEDEPWNVIAGASTTLRDHVTLGIEAGVGERTQFSGSVGWRF